MAWGIGKMAFLKSAIGLIVAIPIGGAAISGVGSALTGGLAGIGGATQSLIGIGILGKAAETTKGLFKF